MMEIKIGLTETDRKEIASGLSRLLADSYTLYLMTHNFHWNVTGPMFNTLHQMFEEEYTELAEAVDEIAERIRALGHSAPGSYSKYAALSSFAIPDETPTAEGMLRHLVEGNEAVVRTARGVLPKADAADDEPTVDLLVERMRLHEKNAWMLRSMLE